MIANPPSLICYPPAALNGGPLEHALAKIGEWVWQPKVDDWRGVLHAPTRTLWNQYGEPSSCSDKFKVALEYIQEGFANRVRAGFMPAEWLDVGLMENRHDLMRGCIIVFDWIDKEASFMGRRALLRSCFVPLPHDVSRLLAETGGQVRDSVYLINQWRAQSPLQLQQHLKDENDAIGHKFYEGLVAKRAQSLYTFGRKPKQVTPDWIKHRMDQQ